MVRNRYLDLLRAVAVARVVMYHATGWAALTIIFPAMATMFALAGSLMAASLDRYGNRAVGRRLRRLLPPLWMIAVLFVPAMLLTGLKPNWTLAFWALPLSSPPSNEWGALALSTMWYLRDYLWFVLLSPLALPLFRRFPVATILAPFGLLGAIELGLPVGAVVSDVGLYFGCWLLGFAHHDGMLRRLSRRVVVGVAGISAAAGAAWFLTHPGPRGYDLNDIRLGNALWSTAFVLVILYFAPTAAAWVDRIRPVGRLVSLFNRRAVTIYLWHMPIVVGSTALLGVLGLWGEDRLGMALRLGAVAIGVTLAVTAFGWVEDIAAKRPRRWKVPADISGATMPVVSNDRGAGRGSAWIDRDVSAARGQAQRVGAGRAGRDADLHIAG